MGYAKRIRETSFTSHFEIGLRIYGVVNHTIYTQEYRSGHNEAVLKTVCPKGTGVRIPLPAPKNTNFSVGVFLFFIFNLCAVTMGEERKTVDNCFSRTKSTKQREMKQGYALSTFRLCDLTGHVELKTVCPKGTGSSHTAAAEYITRNKVFAVSASRGDVCLKSHYAERLAQASPRAAYPPSF